MEFNPVYSSAHYITERYIKRSNESEECGWMVMSTVYL